MNANTNSNYTLLIEFAPDSIHFGIDPGQPLSGQFGHDRFHRIGDAMQFHVYGFSIEVKHGTCTTHFAVEHPADTAWIDKMDIVDNSMKLAVTVADRDNGVAGVGSEFSETAARRRGKKKFIGIGRTAVIHCQRKRPLSWTPGNVQRHQS